jgi:hypothetical protein
MDAGTAAKSLTYWAIQELSTTKAGPSQNLAIAQYSEPLF